MPNSCWSRSPEAQKPGAAQLGFGEKVMMVNKLVAKRLEGIRDALRAAHVSGHLSSSATQGTERALSEFSSQRSVPTTIPLWKR